MDWTDGPGTVAAVVAVIALIGSFIAFVRSLAAEKKAASAEKRAVAAEERANEARDRAAAALERANEIAESQLPSTDPAWELRQLSEHRWLVYNNSPGGGTARNALVEGAGAMPDLIQPDEKEPRDVPAGDGLAFIARRVWGPEPVVRISCEIDGERVEAERTVY